MRVAATSLFNCKTDLNNVKALKYCSQSVQSLPYDTVSFGRVNKFEENKKLFDGYNPQVVDFGSYKIPVHNNKIVNYLKPSYTTTEFSKLFNFADKNGTFDFNINQKTGYVQTSLIDPK